MKLSFFLNAMGVVSLKWYDKRDIPFTSVTKWSDLLNKEITIKTYEKYYACGRIDVHGHPEHPWNYEYGVRVMEVDSWNKFGDWLSNLTLDYLPDSVGEIVDMFEAETNFKILWWEEKNES